ncbi:hypothetical protein PTTG_11615 [Puccinia triticina 1-1 BBBD Race 1]|uniref:Tetratricopeptide repeat protein n=1 Tax=Puccinia triticina (isolate 1-1 / race 1 (BBBD)) TaxID=630390 RepID=A0A0C4FEF9_PUCT1|nr:hypothetical protein PTTG_11615 [Puccinia triticina 1-1 BBBD Race 1]
MVKAYEDYVRVLTEKGPEELAKPANKSKLTEAYNTIGANYADTDKAKAKEYFNKTIALDPANAYATDALKNLK